MFKVPIRNLFCLLSYVNEMPDLVESLNDVDEDLITYDFIGNQFLKEVQALHRRGLIKNYVVKRESTSRLGGRVMMNDSMPYIVARQPIVVCEKDQYSANILLNQVMKSTLKAICFNRFIKEETKKRSFTYMEYMPEVETLLLTRDIFSRINFGRHDIHYKRMIHLARLLHELTLLSHKHGNWSLFNAELDETALNQIFEKFLFHFYRIEQQDYQVASETMRWKLDGNPSFLPSMKTDVSLTHKNGQQKIIMDAKFYKNIFQEHFGRSSFHSHNMYQLFTYLMHQPKELCLRGILIYPFNGVEVDEAFIWSERMTMEILTINLDDSWKEIYRKLMEVLER
ncbi:McrC family protein [Bacillus salipaludis]|uniref:McrC family protein n=1 Tax=Bacillus salipaludis TaxID=2547811 RepID=A0ABW8RGJ7_9BACI